MTDPVVFVDIVPFRRRFSGRKQWKVQISTANHEPIDTRDTYSNVGDIFATLNLLRGSELHVRVHYHDGMETTILRAPDEKPF